MQLLGSRDSGGGGGGGASPSGDVEFGTAGGAPKGGGAKGGGSKPKTDDFDDDIPF